MHQPRPCASSMLWACPKWSAEKAKEGRVQNRRDMGKVQSALEMLTYTSFTKVASGFGKTTPSTLPIELEGLERDGTWIWQCNSTSERRDFSWPSWVEEVDSQVHILSLLTLATILSGGQSSKFKVMCTASGLIPILHYTKHKSLGTRLYCTFTVEMWKGVAMPWIGSITASYFRSGRETVKLYYW